MNNPRISIGSRVAYSVAFLRSTGMYTGPIPFARGVVTDLATMRGGLTIATVDWHDADIPPRVNVSNLAIVGPNVEFAG
jgi:hypothetical protein